MKKVCSISVLCMFLSIISCRKNDCVEYNGYPLEVGKIIINKCATAGCHTDKSKEAAAGLSLESWTSLFQGSRNGNTAVIPFRADLSFLMYFSNTYNDLGITNVPVMPPNQNPLSRGEVTTLRDWINAGAAARSGLLPFADIQERKRLFVVNQGCDNVYVVDAASGVIMRCINIGSNPNSIESPHFLDVSHDDKYFFVCYYNGNMLQKFRTSDGAFVGQANIGSGAWNTFAVTPNDSLAFVVDWAADGKVAVVDLNNMQLLVTYQGSGLLQYPHGSAWKNNWLYVTAQSGNFIYKINVTDIYNPEFFQLPLQPGETPSTIPKYDPHQIHFSPDGSEYNVSCQRSNEVRFFNTANDSLIAVVPVGKYPQHPHYSSSTDYLFVTCMEDDITYPGKIGSVSVINYKTHTFVKSIYTGCEPHGNMVDDDNKRVYILNRNINPLGPPPHHSSACGGKNGYMTAIDMNTLNLVPGYKPEMSTDPYYFGMIGHHH